jgi:DNA-binding MarR family transcriptional regulator
MSTVAHAAPAPTRRRSISPRDPRLAAWRSMITAHARLIDRLDHELREEAGMSLPEYSALLQLAEAPEQRLRMSQLAEGIFLTRSGVTRLIDRLVAEGLVTRRQCASDGRGAEAVLTGHGRDTLRAASRIHLRGIEAYFLASLEAGELDVIESVMNAIEERAAAGEATAG